MRFEAVFGPGRRLQPLLSLSGMSCCHAARSGRGSKEAAQAEDPEAFSGSDGQVCSGVLSALSRHLLRQVCWGHMRLFGLPQHGWEGQEGLMRGLPVP